MAVVSVVCCQVEVSALGCSLVQSSLTECGVSACDCEAAMLKRPWTARGCRAMKKVIICPTISVMKIWFLSRSNT
jgi:hypothetical protein